MLWELSVSADEQSRRIVPIFINDRFILRPLAGRKIWDAILDVGNILSVSTGNKAMPDIIERLFDASRDYAYDTFIKLKEETAKRREETNRKYMYALNLRIDAAERIGIENIKKHKLSQLHGEKSDAEKEHLAGSVIFPDFRPVLVM
jgi:hypothetical protein